MHLDPIDQARQLISGDNHYAAAQLLEQVLAVRPNDVNALNLLGICLKAIGRYPAAETCFRRAIVTEPRFPDVYYNLGALLFDSGKLEEAENNLRQSIALRPAFAMAYRLLSKLVTFRKPDGDVQQMTSLFADPALKDDERMHLAYALGKAYEDLGEYDRSFDFLTTANLIRRSIYDYDPKQELDLFERCIETMDHDYIEQFSGQGIDDTSPLFIVGMPRSGTSLVEQILASHPDVHGAGELFALPDLRLRLEAATDADFPACMEAAPAGTMKEMAQRYLNALHSNAPDTRYITDKLPHNFMHIGLIRAILPQAKIIHCRRNPLDTCLSLYKNYFDGTSLLFSCDLTELGIYYRHYDALMQHWQNLIPEQIFTLDYESLVADMDNVVRSLLDFCRLPFDPHCLTFHQTQRAVRTNSSAQVQQPLYQSSVQSWRHYERHLDPLIEALKPKTDATAY